jgi:hypothetical protein
LDPTVVIVGGKAMWPNVRRAFDTLEAVEEPIFRASLGKKEMFVLSFTHPSAIHPHNWGINTTTPYLLETVVPAIAQLRTWLCIDDGIQ